MSLNKKGFEMKKKNALLNSEEIRGRLKSIFVENLDLILRGRDPVLITNQSVERAILLFLSINREGSEVALISKEEYPREFEKVERRVSNF
nr:hypothetical protein [Leptospira ellisii]